MVRVGNIGLVSWKIEDPINFGAPIPNFPEIWEPHPQISDKMGTLRPQISRKFGIPSLNKGPPANINA